LRELEIRCVIGECEYEVEFFQVRSNDSTDPRVNGIFTKLVVGKGVSTFESHVPNFAGIIKKCNDTVNHNSKGFESVRLLVVVLVGVIGEV
jgi:hypothetical protein